MTKTETENFVEICIYEVKPDKTDEFEQLIAQVAKHHRAQPGVVDVKYMKRTHRQGDFKSIRKGMPAIRLVRIGKSVTYTLYWELKNEVSHGKATESGLNLFYKQFRRFLVSAPKMILGTRIL